MSEPRSGSNWSFQETLVAFRLYCRVPFGKLHQHNPEIIALAARLGRTPSAIGMKACNFASLDPAQRARGIRGLPNHSQHEKTIWERFHEDSETIANEAEEAYERLTAEGPARETVLPRTPVGPTEESKWVRVRRVQGFFRTAVLISYGGRCALTGCTVPAMLSASHIIPWAASPERRADPRNGLCLNALHDRAFDRGLISFSQDHRVIVSPQLRREEVGNLAPVLIELAGAPLVLPQRFEPDRTALEYHRTHIFVT
jgi:putative restriction endonuclease